MVYTESRNYCIHLLQVYLCADGCNFEVRILKTSLHRSSQLLKKNRNNYQRLQYLATLQQALQYKLPFWVCKKKILSISLNMNHECQKDMHFVLTQSKMSIRQSVPNIWGLNYNLQLSAKHPLLHTHSNSILTKPNSNNRPIRLTGSTQRGPSLPFHPIIFLLFKVKLCAFLCTTCHQKTINVLQIQRIWVQYPACPCAAGQNTFCTLFAWQIKEAALK